MEEEKLIWFKGMLSNIEPKDLYLDDKLDIRCIIYYNKDGKFVVQQDYKHKIFRLSSIRIWSVFKGEYFSKTDKQIEDFILPIMNNHFKTNKYRITIW